MGGPSALTLSEDVSVDLDQWRYPFREPIRWVTASKVSRRVLAFTILKPAQLLTQRTSLQEMPQLETSFGEDTDKNRMSISFAVDYDIDDSMSVTAGIGTNSIHEGTNLEYGYALSGKNYSTGFAFGLGFNASF